LRRSIGVTVIAVLSLLGSLFTLLMGAFMIVLPFIFGAPTSTNSPFSPQFFKIMMVGAAFAYILPAAWGIATSIGLFRLKGWARISIIVFSVLLILMCGFGGLMFLVIPIPPTPNQPTDVHIATVVRIFMTTFAGAMVSIGVWWLVFFTRPKVKEQFVPPQPLVTGAAVEGIGSTPNFGAQPSAPPIARRPLSLTVIACLLLAGCFFMPMGLWLRSPGILLTRVLTGWPATLYYVVIIVIQLYVGIGLLRLKPSARTVGVAYYAFFFVNMAVFYLAPGGRSRVLEMLQKSQASMPWIQGQAAQYGDPFQFMSSTPYLVFMAATGLTFALVPLYFLVTRKDAFEKAAAAANGILSSPA
jgi:hypothetical protein